MAIQKQIDPQAWLDRVAEERDRTVNRRHRFMLGMLHKHLDAEFHDRLEETMDTLVEDANFRGWCGGPNPDGKPLVTNRAQIHESYRRSMKDLGGFPPTELVIERMIVSDDGIAMDGQLRRLMNAQSMPQGGGEEGDHYLVEARLALLIPFRGDLMIGEDMYWDPRKTITTIPAPEAVALWNWK